MCPKPNLWELKRECFLVTFSGEDEDEMNFRPVQMSSLREGDLFTMEASGCKESVDPLLDLVAVERIYRAVSEPYHVDDVWQVEAERI
jgi:hypothetical protein